jgi:hypothetical protein
MVRVLVAIGSFFSTAVLAWLAPQLLNAWSDPFRDAHSLSSALPVPSLGAKIDLPNRDLRENSVVRSETVVVVLPDCGGCSLIQLAPEVIRRIPGEHVAVFFQSKPADVPRGYFGLPDRFSLIADPALSGLPPEAAFQAPCGLRLGENGSLSEFIPSSDLVAMAKGASGVP